MFDPAGLVATALTLAAQTPGQATLPAAVRACVDATIATGVDHARLTAEGWDAYDIDTGSAAPLRLYGRGRGPMLMAGVGAESSESGCHVIQPLSGGTGLAAAIAELSAELRAQPTERKPAEAMWVLGDKGVVLEAITRNAKPAAHVTVVNLAEGTK